MKRPLRREDSITPEAVEAIVAALSVHPEAKSLLATLSKDVQARALGIARILCAEQVEAARTSGGGDWTHLIKNLRTAIGTAFTDLPISRGTSGRFLRSERTQ